MKVTLVNLYLITHIPYIIRPKTICIHIATNFCCHKHNLDKGGACLGKYYSYIPHGDLLYQAGAL